MNSASTCQLSDIFPLSVPGEWGADPIGEGNALVLRAADFTKDCKLRDSVGVRRSIPIFKLEQRKLQNGDLLIEKSGGSPDQPVGRVVFFDRNVESTTYIPSNFLQLLRPSERVDGKFVYYLMAHLYSSGRVFRYQQQTTGIINLKLEEYLRERVSIPDLPIQVRLRSILTAIDVAIEKTEALIEKYQQIKAGLMHDLFTRGIGADGQLRPPREQAPELYRQTPIGWIPKEWQYELLDNLALRGSGHTPNKNFPEYWNGGIKWISLADSFRLDRLHIEDTEYEISHLGIQNSSAVLHPAGVVVLSRDAGVGKSAITTQPMAVSQHFMCWRCDGRLDKYFLYYWLQYKKRMFENIAMGSTILTIGLSYFKKLKISAPCDPDEQKNIGRRMQSADEEIFALENELCKLKQQKSGLMHDLLTGNVRVKLNEPSPEMAGG